ncbi:MAG: sensor histidine kinase [Candidatus Limnocylindrales bacterium]
MSASTGGAGLVAAPAPRPGPVRAFLRSPFDPATWRASLAIPLGFGIAIVSISLLSSLFSIGGSLLIVLIGIPFIGLGVECSRLFARVERWRMTLVDPRPLLAHPYRHFEPGPRSPYGPWIRQWAEAEFLDQNRWRDVVYAVVSFPLTMLEFIVAVTLWALALALVSAPAIYLVLVSAGADFTIFLGAPVDLAPGAVIATVVGLVLVPVAASVSRGLMVMHRAVVEGLLCTSPSSALRQDVERLRGTRSAALELEANELRRIERDLHDGAQQRLVMLAIDLGRASDQIDADPASAKVLVTDALDQTRQALAELRDLVRGVSPSILVDRGLTAALGAVAGGCPVPTVVDSELASGERLPAAVERAAYFVVAEALANVAKHSAATGCEVRLQREPGRVLVEVRDDGAGGATVRPGGGLAGLRDRVQALDGTLAVSSPIGGPTVIRVELPTGPAG